MAADSAHPRSCPTRFLGRDRELAELERLVEQHRQVTVNGPPGVGKTRLAAELIARAGARLAAATCWVDLTPFGEPDLVPRAVGSALGIPEAPGRPDVDAVVDGLGDREVLLVLDNCEHLTAGCAKLLVRLLHFCPRVRVLCTSRIRLVVPGERAWTLPVLDLEAAVDLFVDRSQLVGTAVEGGRPEPEVVRQICERLDRLPLAIELAAARTRILSPAEIAQRLHDVLSLLGGGQALAGPRPVSLRTALEWSYSLLEPGQRDLLERLSVFPASFDLDAANAIVDGRHSLEWVVQTVADLADHSLVSVEAAPAPSGTRYRLLETIRQFALERLRDGGSEQEVRTAHALHYLRLAQHADRRLRGPERAAQVRWFRAEHDNLRSALAWAATRPGDLGLELAIATAGYWAVAPAVNEGRAWLERELARTGSPALRATGLFRGARLAWLHGDYDCARRQLRESLAIKQRMGDGPGSLRRLITLITVAMAEGDLDEADRLCASSLEMLGSQPDRGAAAWVHTFWGWTLYLGGRWSRAGSAFEAALAVNQELGNLPGLVYDFGGLASVHIAQGRLVAARGRVEEALSVVRQLDGMPEDQGWLWGGIDLAVAEGRHRSALRLAGAIDAVQDGGEINFNRALSKHWRQALDRARSRFGEAEAARLRAEGAHMATDALIAEILAPPAARPAAGRDALSSREAEVLALVVRGRTNRQIARELGISPKTVANHLTSILGKTGAANRTEASTYAIRQGLA